MSSQNLEYEITVPLLEDDLVEGFEVADELAQRASIESESWQAFKKVLDPLRKERPATWQHSQRVATYALGMAAVESGWDDKRLLVYGALAHDIGKLDVPKEVAEDLEGFGAEKENKMALIRPHAENGYNRMRTAGFPFTAAVAGGHHLYQRDDPYGIPLNKMPLTLTKEDKEYLSDTIRFVALADHFDAMTTRANNLGEAERRTALIRDFSLPIDLARIDWLEANEIT